MTNQEEPVKKSNEWDMIAIQEECKKKYPIGCIYEDGSSHVLELDEYTYGIFCNNMIYAHSGGGCLFHHGTWAKLISLPETKIEDKPKFEVGKWYEIVDKYYTKGEFIFKFLKQVNESIYYSETIRKTAYKVKEDYHVWGKESVLIDLSEIQQYLPDGHVNKFTVKPEPMKELVELPEKWCIKSDETNKDVLTKWRTDGSITGTIGYYLHTPMHGKKGYNKSNKDPDYTEITFEDFKRLVLKESTVTSDITSLPNKWCIKVTKENQQIVGKYYNRKGAIAYTDADRIGKYLSSHNLSSGISVMSETENHGSNFCMRTCESYTEITFDQFKKWVLKEVYDDQFPTKITFIDKWSIGTYVVFIKTVSPLRTLGFIDKITDSYSNSVNLEKSANCVMQRETDREIMWFATKQEAEDFAKTLIIENTYESTSKHVLLEQAKKRYPVGTVIDSLGGMPNEIISTNDPYFVGNGTDSIRFNNDQLVYSNGEWAKIISKPTSISSSFNMQEILEEAKRRFPIGCTFYPIQKNGSLSTSVYTQKQECRIYSSNDGPDWIIGTANVRNGSGEWAKIVSLPKEKEHPFPEVKISEYIPGQNYPQPTPMESYKFKFVDINPVYKNDKFVLPTIPIITPLLRV